MSETTKPIRDGDNNPFDVQYYRRPDGSHNVVMRRAAQDVTWVDVTVGTTAQTIAALVTAAGGTVPDGLLAIEVANLGTVDVMVGPSNVSTSVGLPVHTGGTRVVPSSDAAGSYLVAASSQAVLLALYS